MRLSPVLFPAIRKHLSDLPPAGRSDCADRMTTTLLDRTSPGPDVRIRSAAGLPIQPDLALPISQRP